MAAWKDASLQVTVSRRLLEPRTLYRRVLGAATDGHHLVSSLRVRLADGQVAAECRYHFIGGPQLRIQVLVVLCCVCRSD
jgi:hypothetical protein